jgi:hypothetical protein
MSISTLKAGDSANARRILAGLTSTTSAPSTSADGLPMGAGRRIYLYFKIEGSTVTCGFTAWVYSAISETWHKLPTTYSYSEGNHAPAPIELPDGTVRFALQWTSESGSATVTAWAGVGNAP